MIHSLLFPQLPFASIMGYLYPSLPKHLLYTVYIIYSARLMCFVSCQSCKILNASVWPSAVLGENTTRQISICIVWVAGDSTAEVQMGWEQSGWCYPRYLPQAVMSHLHLVTVQLSLRKEQLKELPMVFIMPGTLAACFQGRTTRVPRKAEWGKLL